ncbi:hypothetical protein HY450_02505 [Candidatus Pacearchaeota archaeon]|nr:hypothetical protein [Candidatus Pacearchaeota archaeon]
MRKNISGLALAGCLLFGGCVEDEQKPRYIEGVVLEESGTVVQRQRVIEESSGALFGNESVKVGNPTYAIKFKSDEGKIYNLSVWATDNFLEALALAIEKDTKIKVENDSYSLEGPLRRVDVVKWDKIEVLGK